MNRNLISSHNFANYTQTTTTYIYIYIYIYTYMCVYIHTSFSKIYLYKISQPNTEQYLPSFHLRTLLWLPCKKHNLTLNSDGITKFHESQPQVQNYLTTLTALLSEILLINFTAPIQWSWFKFFSFSVSTDTHARTHTHSHTEDNRDATVHP